jgi:hypothetical protein
MYLSMAFICMAQPRSLAPNASRREARNSLEARFNNREQGALRGVGEFEDHQRCGFG